MSKKICDIKKRIEQLEAQRGKLQQQAKQLSRKNTTQLKILTGVHLFKLAQIDTEAKAIYDKVITIVKAEKPELF